MDNQPENSTQFQSQLSLKFDTRTLFVLVSVVAVSAACFVGLINATQNEMSDVLWLIPVTAAAPMILMVFVCYVLKLGDWFVRRQNRRRRDEHNG